MPAKKPKYKNYAELSAAFKSGELRKGYYMMLDKGGTANSLNFYDDMLSDDENEKLQEECDGLFNFLEDDHECGHIGALYETLGIPCEWC